MKFSGKWDFPIDILEKNGYEAYLVGGTLRDILLSKEAKDIDIATSALPQQIIECFNGFITIETGKQFGTITVVIENQNIEITTFRSESGYYDSRRPSNVLFENDIKKDLLRRDFTINAMAYNRNSGLIDISKGQEDLKNKLIRSVGNPYERFTEDALRMLRCVRFATLLNFHIEQSTFDAIKELAPLVKAISKERINVEFTKIIKSSNPSKGIRLLNDSGLLDEIIPEIIPMDGFKQMNPYHDMDLLEHTLCVLENVKPTEELRLAALFHDIGKLETLEIGEDNIGHFYGHEKVSADMAYGILKRLNYPNKTIEKVNLLIKEHMIAPNAIGKKGIKRLLNLFGEEDIFDLVDLHKGDSSCTTLGHQDLFEEKVREILYYKEPFSRKDLDINGNDLKNIGFSGKEIGIILEKLLDFVMEDPDLNTHEQLLRLAKQTPREKH